MAKQKKVIDLFFNIMNDGGLKIVLSEHIDRVFKKGMPGEVIQEWLKALLMCLLERPENKNCAVQINLNLDSSVSDKHTQLLYAAAEQAIAKAEIRIIICFSKQKPASIK